MLDQKKSKLEPIALKDPESGILVMEPEEIKEVSVNYVVNLLKNRKPNAGFENIFKEKELLHEIRMDEKIPGDNEELTEDMYNKAIEKVSKTHKSKCKFILNGGRALQNAVFDLFSSVWKSENIPEGWYNSN